MTALAYAGPTIFTTFRSVDLHAFNHRDPFDNFLWCWRRGVETPTHVETVNPLEVVATQDNLDAERLAFHMENQPRTSKDFPWLVRHNGRLYVFDGHHRTAATILKGQTTMQANVTDIDTLPMVPHKWPRR